VHSCLCQSWAAQVNLNLVSLLSCVSDFRKLTPFDAYWDTVQTNKAVHIAVTAQKDGVVSTTMERKIPLVTIKSISMSTMRDDWMVS
jgi:hypothetical protein